MQSVPDTIISVQGEHRAWYPAERATVRISVHAFGPKRDAVLQRSVSAADTIRGQLEPMLDKNAGPVTWWASDRVSVWSERPWNNEGKQLPLVYHSAIDFTAKFKDFDALSAWVEQVAGLDDVVVSSLTWDLTDATRTSANTEVRSRAVKDAVAKAAVFAQAVGLGSVTAIAVADPGMLGDPGAGGGGAFAPASRMMKASFDAQGGGGPQLQLKPEDIEVACVVDARFTAK
jgi:uncharacterized protein YggE